MQKITMSFDMTGEFLGNKLSKIKYLFVLICFISGITWTGFAQGYVLDPTFGNLGKSFTLPDGLTTARAYAMALQADGKIIMVGSSGANPGLFVARYNANGSLDTTFGGLRRRRESGYGGIQTDDGQLVSDEIKFRIQRDSMGSGE